MAASNRTSVFSNTDDATFRAWCSFIDAGIIAGGWVHTADTGQIDLTTVIAPVAADTSKGYKIYQSQDASGALNDYYLKLEFGSFSSNALRPGVWVTLGWETNGAGTLLSSTYPISTRLQVGCANNGTPPQYIAAGSATDGAGYICFTSSQNFASSSMMFSIERTRDADLDFQDELLLLNQASGTFGISVVLNRVSTLATSAVALGVMPANANTPIAGRAGLGICFGVNPSLTSPSMNVFGVETSALGAAGDSISVPILGANHVYKLQDVQGTFIGIASTSLLTRYE